MTFGRFIAIIQANGFEVSRDGRGSHRLYRGVIKGNVQIVTVAGHRQNDDIPSGTLSTMIRQSGLDKKLFR